MNMAVAFLHESAGGSSRDGEAQPFPPMSRVYRNPANFTTLTAKLATVLKGHPCSNNLKTFLVDSYKPTLRKNAFLPGSQFVHIPTRPACELHHFEKTWLITVLIRA
jgi:hypothetical protein